LRIEIPTYGRFDGTVHKNKDSVYLKDKLGIIKWSYSGKDTGSIKVAACPRSGTVYMTEVLRKFGYNVGHEESGEDGSVGYHLAVVRPDNCLHQVRHPLKQIASMLAHRNWGFSGKIVKVDNYRLLGCMQLWIRMNILIEEFAVGRYQVEELPNVWDWFCEKIGHEKCDIPDVPTDTNKDKRTEKLTWANLYECDGELAHDIYMKSLEYGYVPLGQNVFKAQDNLVA
jgi:hypothetical protein